MVKLREIIAVADADTQQLQLPRVGGPPEKLDAFYVYYKKTTTRLRYNFVYTDDSLQLAWD